MRQLAQSAQLAEDRIGFRGVLAVASIVAVIAGSLAVASRLDPILRRFAPNPDGYEQAGPVISVRPAASPPVVTPQVAPESALAPPPSLLPAPSAIPAPGPAPARPRLPPIRDVVSLPQTLPDVPPPRPSTAAGTTEEPQRNARRERESRRQVASNVRNLRHDSLSGTETADAPQSLAGVGAYALVSEARRYIGTNPTRMAKLWCARFTNYVLQRAGYHGTGSDAALSFASYGRRVHGPRIGAIAVMRRKGGGHVGIVSGVDRQGNPILISGNNGRYGVAETVYPRRRIIAYVMPR